MFVTCKQDLESETENITKGKSYKIYGEDDNYYFIIVDGNKNISFYLMKFSKTVYKNDAYRFDFFFYTLKEERKLKLEKIRKIKKIL